MPASPKGWLSESLPDDLAAAMASALLMQIGLDLADRMVANSAPDKAVREQVDELAAMHSHCHSRVAPLAVEFLKVSQSPVHLQVLRNAETILGAYDRRKGKRKRVAEWWPTVWGSLTQQSSDIELKLSHEAVSVLQLRRARDPTEASAGSLKRTARAKNGKAAKARAAEKYDSWLLEFDGGAYKSISKFAIEKKVARDTMSKGLKAARARRESVNVHSDSRASK